MKIDPPSPKFLIIDVDGVMTTGQFLYSADGKVLKVFGPDDHDALSLLSQYMDIQFVTGDKIGYAISEKRISGDMGFQLDLVSTIRRIDWIKQQYDPNSVIYIGDGIFDHYVMKEVGYSIAPANSDDIAKKHADYITKNSGGERAVAEACLHIMEKFFQAYDPGDLPDEQIKLSGRWKL